MSTDTQAPRVPSLRTFDDFIRAQENGDLNQELSHDLRKVFETLDNHVLEHGGKPEATLTLKLKFTHEGQHISVGAANDLKLPKAPRTEDIYYIGKNQEITKRNPRQRELFEDVPGGRGDRQIVTT